MADSDDDIKCNFTALLSIVWDRLLHFFMFYDLLCYKKFQDDDETWEHPRLPAGPMVPGRTDKIQQWKENLLVTRDTIYRARDVSERKNL